MNVYIGAGNVNAVKTSLVSTANDNVVDITTLAVVQDQMECGRINQLEVVEREIGDIDQPDQAGTVGVLAKEGVPIALHGTLRGSREELEITGILDNDHMAACSACSVDDPVQLKSPSRTPRQSLPG